MEHGDFQADVHMLTGAFRSVKEERYEKLLENE